MYTITPRIDWQPGDDLYVDMENPPVLWHGAWFYQNPKYDNGDGCGCFHTRYISPSVVRQWVKCCPYKSGDVVLVRGVYYEVVDVDVARRDDWKWVLSLKELNIPPSNVTIFQFLHPDGRRAVAGGHNLDHARQLLQICGRWGDDWSNADSQRLADMPSHRTPMVYAIEYPTKQEPRPREVDKLNPRVKG